MGSASSVNSQIDQNLLRLLCKESYCQESYEIIMNINGYIEYEKFIQYLKKSNNISTNIKAGEKDNWDICVMCLIDNNLNEEDRDSVIMELFHTSMNDDAVATNIISSLFLIYLTRNDASSSVIQKTICRICLSTNENALKIVSLIIDIFRGDKEEYKLKMVDLLPTLCYQNSDTISTLLVSLGGITPILLLLMHGK